MARLRSRIGTEPSTTTEPSGWARTPATTTSCSSEISPTISSKISSSVTMPSTSPYSSTTSAKWVLRRRNALSCSETGRISGTNQGGTAQTLGRRQDRLVGADRDAQHLHQRPHDLLDDREQRPKDIDHQLHRAGDQ